MISTTGLAKSFGDRTLFSNVALRLQPGERYGLVGANGSGKTTLLNILSGDVEPSEGAVSIPRGLRLGVLRQDQFAYEEEEILRVAMRGNPVLWEALAAREALLAHVQAGGEFDADRFSRLEEVVERYDGYTAEARAAAILEGLGLPAACHRDPLSTLSGGFRLRVLLAQVLAGAPDALLLDEPTNHLDILSIRWLEKFMRDFKGPLVVISHDHRFLDNIVTHILDVDYETVLAYPGNYSAFRKSKRAEHERREKEIVRRDREIAHHQKFVDRFRAKASKARQAQSKLRLIEKKAASLETLPGSSRRYPAFRFEPVRASGREVFEARGLRKSFGDNQVLHGVDFGVRRGDRLAILGPNGIGKSTLLKIALGEMPADAGSVRWGYETHVGYFAQDHEEQLDEPGRTAQDWIWDACAGRDIGYVRAQMGLVLFSGDEAAKPLSALSGGEAARLVFCRLAIQQPNVLVLDEPTNHLDLESIEALVEALKGFAGTLVFVSHDRWFVSRLATRILEITPGGVRDYPGTYDEYVHASGDDHLDVDTVVLKARREKRKDRGAAAPPPWRHPSSKPRAPDPATEARRDRAFARLEAIESRLAEIDATFADTAFYQDSDPAGIRELQAERERLATQAERLTEEWMALEEEMETR
ncbi:MAG: ABC-F family ATP-binding cassette domain-containing protein [Gammaproteobacteria bacterium]|nr:ABC-F family ATP-binding cassette domain-containing protein [Gammaproteobacteria bacterium]